MVIINLIFLWLLQKIDLIFLISSIKYHIELFLIKNEITTKEDGTNGIGQRLKNNFVDFSVPHLMLTFFLN